MRFLLLGIAALLPILIQGSDDVRSFTVKYTSEPIAIDGDLTEDIWKSAEALESFWNYFPVDTSYANDQTKVMMAYDDDNLYIAAIAYKSEPGYVVPTLKRDYRAGGNDNLTFLFDTFGDGQNCFFFGVNPYGVQREGLIAGGGLNSRDFKTSWDNKWSSSTKRMDDMYVTEIQIPFNILRYSSGTQKWRFNSYRFDMQANERSTWINIPRNQNITHLGFMGDMVFEKPLEKISSGISFIPYGIIGSTLDKESSEPADFRYNIGGDAKIPITSGLNLDLTINPDFSQVEVDRQVTNLDRFEIFFPERRQFFLENEDLFSGYGFRSINPFFSRRIGISIDTSTETNIQNTIFGGARMSGKINDDFRIGVLNMVTAKDEINGQPTFNFGVIALQHKVGDKSNISGIFVNKQSLSSSEGIVVDEFNRVGGLDYNFISKNNDWSGKVFLHRSFSQQELKNPFSHGAFVSYIKPTFSINYSHAYVGEGYDAQTGFVRRTDYYSVDPNINYSIFPKSGIVNRHQISLSMLNFYKPSIGLTDRSVRLNYNIQFLNRSRLNFRFSNQYIYLFDAFDPTGTDSEVLPADTDYNYRFAEINFSSNAAYPLNANAQVYLGQYYNGQRMGISGRVNYRVEPFATLGINYAFNSFEQDHLNGNRQTLLLGPNLDISFNKSIFLSTFVQYNSQSENTNINARFQWRFAPVSDFFIVYSNNYFTGDDPSNRFVLREKNRSIVAKVTYWINT